ncbi:uncharacterized protein LOC119677883 [Teleopsis dalmanni]|uniref:uncharacterized protein LOC119677883 n=1 Tax=Teleopsis dalmanni TaxID=139649 RepID=UPI0018CCBD46|nr:uncharacterized protein LOC119677883 [Teleopsis dalmanni]
MPSLCGSNPFESNNPFENESDDAIQRGKRALRDEVMATQRYVEHEAEDGKGKVRQFFSDMRAKSKNISCRNEKSIQVDDEPPRYAVNGHSNTNNQLQPTSKVCVLL